MNHWRLVGILCLSLCAFAAQAQTRYVSDTLVITFRTGPGNEFAVTRNLTSGDRVEVLEQPDDEAGYARVRLDDGSEGWVLWRYLQPEPTAELRLQSATRELNEAGRDVGSLGEQVTTLQAELNQTRQQLDAATTRAARLDAELADIRSASADAIATRELNERLNGNVSTLTAELSAARAEIGELESRNRQSWFIVGAAVLFGGIIIGLVAPSLRRNRRSSW